MKKSSVLKSFPLVRLHTEQFQEDSSANQHYNCSHNPAGATARGTHRGGKPIQLYEVTFIS